MEEDEDDVYAPAEDITASNGTGDAPMHEVQTVGASVKQENDGEEDEEVEEDESDSVILLILR